MGEEDGSGLMARDLDFAATALKVFRFLGAGFVFVFFCFFCCAGDLEFCFLDFCLGTGEDFLVTPLGLG